MIIELVDAQQYDEHRMLAAVEVTDDDGTVRRVAHVLPYDAAEWRIAEYELDPNDPATADDVVDILLFEAHTPVHEDIVEEQRLYAAATVADARDALLGAVRARKATSEARKAAARANRAGKAAADPAQTERTARNKFISLCVVDAEVVALKQEHVRAARDRVAAERAASRAAGPIDRAAALRPLPKDDKERKHRDAPVPNK